jgi:hypothetical protein
MPPPAGAKAQGSRVDVAGCFWLKQHSLQAAAAPTT